MRRKFTSNKKSKVPLTDDRRPVGKSEAAVFDRITFFILRGSSSLCFLPSAMQGKFVVPNDSYANSSMFVVMVCSLVWNILAFALPGAATPGTWVVSRPVVILASTLDGYGMAGSSMVALSHTLKLGVSSSTMWALATIYSLYEHLLMTRSQGPHCPQFTGLSGSTITKLHYPFHVHVVRSSCVGCAILTSAWHLFYANETLKLVALLLAMAIGFGTYMTNGYDRDFTCLRVWIWHGCVGVFSFMQTEALGMLTEQHLASLRI
mmetsp:Transcript_28445/g.58172  ORF Transcript_28445/g.58172 Transcript_28445/m.58172 type:complete len:263 (+) Transcript_28445:101-889(+)